MQILMIYMLLIILVINFIKSFLSVFFKLKFKEQNLLCGITAFCGAKPADPNLIKMIMMFNMERGEDGTGWAVNNVVEKDTEKVSKFIQNHTLDISPDDENFTIVAHARKSSSGTKNNKELVHPFSIYKEGVEKEKPDLILAMNGTLSNTALVAKTFEIEFKEYTNSDTQVVAKAMAKLGEKEYIKVIQGYDGTATLVFFTPKHSNTLMVYKDPLKTLFYWQKSANEMYISSMEEPLLAVGVPKIDILPFENEHLYRISKGKITKKDKIERDPLKAKAIYRSNGSNCYVRQRDDMYESEDTCNFGNFSKIVNVNSNSTPKRPSINKNIHAGKGNLVYCIIDKYYRNGHPCDTVIIMNKNGEISKTGKEDDVYKKHYFVCGYLCKDEKNYDELIKKCSDKKENFDKKRFKGMLLSSLIEYFQYPILTFVDGKEKWILNKEYSEKLKESKNQELQIDFMLSTHIIRMKDGEEFTSTTLKDICNTIEYIEKKNIEVPVVSCTDLTEINNRHDLTKQHMTLVGIIKNDDRKAWRANYYYSMMRIEIYKCNPFPELSYQFFNILLTELKNFNIISEKIHSRLVSDLDNRGYEKHAFNSEVDEYTKQLYHLLNSIKQDKKIDSQLCTKDKLLLLDKEGYSEEDIIKSIQEVNTYYLNDNFNNDIIDHSNETFDSLIVQWVNTDVSGDVTPFLEGVLLCINKIGEITNSELLDILDNGYLDLKRKTENVWKNWMKTYDQQGDPVEDAKRIIEKDAIVIESSTPEDYEQECRWNIQNIVDSMIQYSNEVETTELENRTKFVKESLKHIESTIGYIRRYILKSEKKENENQQ